MMTATCESLKLLMAQKNLPFTSWEQYIDFCKDKAKLQNVVTYNFIMQRCNVLILNSGIQTGRELKPEHPKLTRGTHQQKL